MKTLYVSDLDGTLLGSRGELSGFTRDAINELTEKGVLFTFATARSIHSAGPATRGLRLSLPVITHNGATTADPATGNTRSWKVLGKETGESLRQRFQRQNTPLLAYAIIEGRERVSWLLGNENQGIAAYLESRRGGSRLRGVSTWEELFMGEAFYFTLIGTRLEQKALYRELKDTPGCYVGLQADTYNTEEWWLEIYREDATKAAAVRELREQLGVDRVVCFGDHLNDLSMFRACEVGCAVANAQPELKAAATVVIGSNEEDGVARWLLEHAGKEEMAVV